MRVKLSAIAFILICLICATFGACSSTRSSNSESQDDGSPVVAEINGRGARKAAFERFLKSRLSDFIDQSGQVQEDVDRQRSELLDEFIKRQLIIQEAVKNDIKPTDDEIRSELEEQHRQASTQGEEQNQAVLDTSERRVEIYNDLSMRKYQAEVLKLKDVSVTPQEIEEYYKQNTERYQGKGGFLVREIRVSREDLAQKLYRQALAKPADFAVLARDNSESPTKINGGEMEYETKSLPQVLEQAITPLKVGAISRVVQSNYGYHIFKLERRVEPVPLDKARKEIEDKLKGEKNQSLIENLDKRLQADAKIKIYRDRLGFNYVGNF
ncbi:MAG TPA: peptidyl-prolyl cis-trans isomerase [Blastocatellia bacterium]|jgi:parvulin-like peptidyl-prolyl isomerase|nr:peptidyl-prolyl cis-trans isomerase [Blastocatellia bacterium]